MHRKKRGYFFELDAALALFILIIGAFLISSYYLSVPHVAKVDLLSEDILKFMTNTKIEDINSPYIGVGGEMWQSQDITDPKASLLQQVGEFYTLKKMKLADSFVSNVTRDIVPPQYYYELWMNDQIMFPQEQPPGHNLSKNSTGLLLVSRAISYGLINKTTGSVWGPYKAEVHVWQR